MTRLDKQRQQLEDLLTGVTAFNAKSRIEAIQELLEKYVPNVERMKNQLKKYSGAFSETRAENKRLKAEIETLKTEKAELAEQLKAASTESIQKRLKTGKLQEDYEKARSILARIPPEVQRYYTANARPEPGRTGPNRTRKGDALE
jgi:archaellum component FlaC